MDRIHQDAEAYTEQLNKLIAARTEATENDILGGRKAVIAAVAEKCGEGVGANSLNCDEDEAEALVKAAVLGRCALVGARIAGVVQYAIYQYVLPLAQGDVAEMERAYAASAAEARIDALETF